MKKTRANWRNLILGVVIDAMAVALITKSDFGISAVSSTAYTLSCVFPVFTFGVWSYLFQFGLFLIMCFLVRKCTAGYLCSFLVGVAFGYTLDFCRFCINPLPDGTGFRLMYFIMGTLLLIVGVAMLMISRMPIMPQDLFTRELSEHFSIPFRRVKTAFDVSCVLLSLLTALAVEGRIIGIGVGTVINALIIGKSVDRVKKILIARDMA